VLTLSVVGRAEWKVQVVVTVVAACWPVKPSVNTSVNR